VTVDRLQDAVTMLLTISNVHEKGTRREKDRKRVHLCTYGSFACTHVRTPMKRTTTRNCLRRAGIGICISPQVCTLYNGISVNKTDEIDGATGMFKITCRKNTVNATVPPHHECTFEFIIYT